MSSFLNCRQDIGELSHSILVHLHGSRVVDNGMISDRVHNENYFLGNSIIVARAAIFKSSMGPVNSSPVPNDPSLNESQ